MQFVLCLLRITCSQINAMKMNVFVSKTVWLDKYMNIAIRWHSTSEIQSSISVKMLLALFVCVHFPLSLSMCFSSGWRSCAIANTKIVWKCCLIEKCSILLKSSVSSDKKARERKNCIFYGLTIVQMKFYCWLNHCLLHLITSTVHFGQAILQNHKTPTTFCISNTTYTVIYMRF